MARPASREIAVDIRAYTRKDRGVPRLTRPFGAGLLLAALMFGNCSGVGAQQPLPAVANDPAPDRSNPAGMESMQLPSHGRLLNAFVYIAAGPGPHPVVMLLHGFPGNERNLDLAQAIRRAGWDVLYFDYRGSWGSPGNFSFTHSMEDTQAAVAFLQDPATSKKLRADSHRIVLIGHSMGGFLAVHAAAQDSSIEAVGMISATNLGARDSWPSEPGRDTSAKTIAATLADEGMAPLAGCTPESLALEIIANRPRWNFVDFASKLAKRPILVVTSDDGLAAANDAFVAAVKKYGNRKLTALHLTTDHAYSDHRIALQAIVLTWLDSLH